ncbi:uncharacterized protein BT62DRAFT_922542 [Guyanagaster necrorhizus]|uniref:Uncharacterized protein n=1 Tax=Guyanagaster necrorhizus TaxID=856835 RepID=A0A9P7VL31_9AGAR|nr:uncharacterized protein BT62DRAFT_922542 [Guyanagaster necrorhizus MCA 3950]KAG7442607.1 hypothetical protein BT62DRAFT_922542 [Guyanagaster necrorhizus MCA 3950]
MAEGVPTRGPGTDISACKVRSRRVQYNGGKGYLASATHAVAVSRSDHETVLRERMANFWLVWIATLTNTSVVDSSFYGLYGKIAGTLWEGDDELNYQVNAFLFSLSIAGLMIVIGISRVAYWGVDRSANDGDHIVSKYGDNSINRSIWSRLRTIAEPKLQTSSKAQRNKLPIAGYREDIIAALDRSQVLSLNVTVRDHLVRLVHQKAASNSTAGVFPTTYNTGNGSAVGGQISSNVKPSPAQGSVFSLLALNLTTQPIETPTSGASSSLSSSPSTVGSTINVGAIVGSVVASVPAVTSAQALTLHSKRRPPSSELEPEPEAAPEPEADVRREVESLRRQVEAIRAQKASPPSTFGGGGGDRIEAGF